MSPRGWTIVGVVGIVAGVAGLGAVFLGRSGSPRDWIASQYTQVSSEGNSSVYSSDRSPTVVADEIGAEWKPVDRVIEPSGEYLRYSNDYIGVVPAAAGGSRIYVDDQNRGYARWFPYIGGTWGTYSAGGYGGGFRGGGPGAGK